MMGKREAVRAILEGKSADRIPVIMNCCSLPPAQYGYDMFECLTNPEKMAECSVGSRRRLGYDGLYDDRLDLVLDEHGDAWHLADTSTKKIKDLYGDKISLMGTIPSVAGMLEMSADELYKFAYQECMDGARDGRFILSADCDVPPSTPDENMRAVVQAARDAEKVLFG